MHAHELVFLSLRVMIKRTIMDKKRSLDNLFAFLTLFLLGFLGSPVLRAQDQGILKLQNDMYHVSIMDVDGVRVLHIEGWLPSLGDPVRIPVRTIELPLAGSTAQRYGVQSVVLDSGFYATPFYYAEFERTSDTTFSTMLRVVPQHLRPADDYSQLRILSHRIVRRKAGDVLQMVLPLVTLSSDGRCSFVRSFELYPLAEDGRAAQIPTVSDIPEFYSDMPFIRRAQGALDTSGTWIDHNETYRKFSVRQDGVYRIDKIWLSQAGYDTSTLDPSQVQLIRRGQSIPLLAVGFEDGVFGATDGFLFHGARNYDPTDHRSVPTDPDESYPQYLNLYSDSTVYFVHLDPNGGVRVQEIEAQTTASTDTLTWAYHLVHVENDVYLFSYSSRVERIQYSDWTSEDSYWAGWIGPGTAQYTVLTPFVKQGIPARVAVRAGTWYGPANNDLSFVSSVRVNGGQTLDSTAQPNNSGWVLRAIVPPTDVRSDTNRVYYQNHSTAADPRTFLFDWYEFEYPRELIAVNNMLTFTIDSSIAKDVRAIRVKNYQSDNIAAFRITSGGIARIKVETHKDGAKWDAVIIDTVQPGTIYVVADPNAAVRPVDGAPVTVRRLRNAQEGAGYLVITTREFKDAASDYAEMVTQAYAVRTKTVFVEDIYDNYSYGFFNPEAIKVYLYDLLNTPGAPELNYVLLAGDANYHVRINYTKYSRNFVPTYGFPAGDTWFAAYDSLSIAPQVSIGRLPVRNATELSAYKAKHERYVAARQDDWNKTFMFFSSGDPAEGEANLLSYRNVNSGIIRNIIEPRPLAGKAVHFYKTITPRSDLGPYDPSYISAAIDNGAVMISYIGHSGTQTWDNSIGDVAQLANKRNRNPLISDFGCSTGKFAEPDVAPFAELFVTDVDGDAIGYIGNSSLGFQSTARTLPSLFYSIVVTERSNSVGDAHAEMKRRLITNYGNNAVNRISVRSNTLVGDPIVALPIASKMNLVARNNWIVPEDKVYKDNEDSAVFRVIYGNYGAVAADSAVLEITSTYNTQVTLSQRYKVPVPVLEDTLRAAVPIRSMSGVHSVVARIDPDNEHAEVYEDDNIASIQMNVASTRIKVVNSRIERVGGQLGRITILNPLYLSGQPTDYFHELSGDLSFRSVQKTRVPYGHVVSVADSVGTPAPGAWFWRIVNDDNAAQPVGPYKYHSSKVRYSDMRSDDEEYQSDNLRNMKVMNDTLRMLPLERRVQVISAGFLDGSFGIVSLDGVNVLPNTYFRSYVVVLVDSVTIQPYDMRYYDLYGDPTSPDSLIRFVNGARPGTLFIIATADEPRARNNVIAPTIRSLGSKYIGTLGDRSSWAMIGWRGAATGTIPEAYKPSTAGRVIVDTVFQMKPDTASIAISSVGPSARWSFLDVGRSGSSEVRLTASLSSTATGQNLLTIDNLKDRIDLSGIDAGLHPKLDVKISMYTEGVVDSAYISYIGIAYDDLPELALNYQSVTLTDSTVEQGDSVRISVGVLNPGEGMAGPFTVALDVVDDQNVRRPVDSVRVASLGRDAWFSHRFAVNTTSMKGSYQAIISVDRNGEVDEQYEDNNVYMTSFTVRQDTMRPTIDVTFDDAIVFDGDYVRPRPVVRVTLKDLSPLPVTSADKFRIVVNDSLVPTNTSNFRLVETVPYAILEYLPASDLEAGENIFAFNATDASGNKAYQDDLQTRVRVSYETAVDRVFNYPNPFTDGTAFSFLLIGSKIPDAASIMVYTVTGRKIKTIDLPPDRLRIGYNVIPWDGRDEDGDRLANGTYFFKVLVRSAGSSLEQIGRIAVLR
jgi:hypothetical protein